MKNYKSVLCAAPFSAIFISKTIAKTCCAIDYGPETQIDVINDKSILDHFNEVNLNLRQDFIQGKLNRNCTNCTIRTDNIQRYHYNDFTNENIDHIANPALSYLHIDFSNVCNLACRICTQKSSNLLHKEMELLGLARIDEPVIKRLIDRDSKLYTSILENLDKIRYVRFSGGEPLLHEEVWTLLESICQKGYSKDIVFKVNTNGTVKLTEEKYNILKSFKAVYIEVSMDGINEHAEYIRTNVIWDRWINNIKEYKKEFKNYTNFNLGIVCTLSVFNIHIFDTIKKYFDSLRLSTGTNMLFWHEQFCVFNINQQSKDYLNELYKDKYPDILHFVNLENKIDPREIVKYIDKRDDIVIANNLYKNYRRFRDVDPEWYTMLKG
jgi:MoaA/NifB/PqqE/SkfB family radical SAM enzyme